MARRARQSRVRRPLAALLLVAAAAWGVGFHGFLKTVPQLSEPADPPGPTDAIVVLTGGSERLGEGLALLREGRGRKLFVSGVYRGVDVTELLRVTSAGSGFRDLIVLGHDADDTAGNARETAAWMAEQGYASLRLVTAAYHMPRSLFEFRAAMPGFDIVAHPVFPQAVRLDAWWRYPGTASLLAGEYLKLLLAKARMTLVRAAGIGPGVGPGTGSSAREAS